jgi:IS5 family transposase
VLRRRYEQGHLGQLVLLGTLACKPEDLMEPQLRRVDALLDDEAIVDAVADAMSRRAPRSRRWGRGSTPAETVLRLLALRYLKSWSYDQLVWEVTGNVVYRRFCRIDGHAVPNAKTLIKLHAVLGRGPALQLILDRLVGVAIEKKVTRGRRMRIDTTVVEAPIRHPMDNRLCEDAIRVLGRGMRRLREAGVELGFRLRNVKRSVSRRMRELAAALRRKTRAARKKAVVAPYRKLLIITRRFTRQAQRAIRAARQQLDRLPDLLRRRVQRTADALEKMLPIAGQVIRQTRARIQGGNTRSDGKLVSIFEPWAQVLRRGKRHRPTEFGKLVKVQESEGGIVTDIGVADRAADAPLLVPGAERHRQLFGRAPDLVATDRGFYSTRGEQALRSLGVRHPVIPKPGHRSRERVAYEQQRWFRRGRAWRTGGEARIARLKHRFGMARSRNRGERGLAVATYWAAIANNLMAIAARTT